MVSRNKKLPVVLNEREREYLLNQPNPRYLTGFRNQLTIQIMLNIGLRLAEAVNLKWEDIDFLSETLMVREGKGMKDRVLYIKNDNWRGENDKELLQMWKQRQTGALLYLPEYVFTTVSKNSAGKKLSDRYIQNMIVRYGVKASINKKISPHTLRHTFATDLYRKTKDPVVVKNALGHSDLSTTMVYVHLVSGDIEEALSG